MGIWKRLMYIWRNDDGMATVEYALILMAIVVVGIVAWQAFSNAMGGMVGNGTNSFINAGQ